MSHICTSPMLPHGFLFGGRFGSLQGFSGNISMRLSFNENVSTSTATIVSIVANVFFVVVSVFAYL